MRFTLDDVLVATNGRRIGPLGPIGAAPADRVVLDGAAIDSRAVRSGQLFVPVVAERDGHDFIPAAVAAGAGAFLTSRTDLPPGAGAVPGVLVDDTVAALAGLGRLARQRIGDRVVAVTGSVGKTSVKDLLASTLRRRWVTAAALRSFNNELGVPLTLVNAPAGAAAAAIEMGARGRGHIATLCAIARPTVGIVTVVGGAHLELFGSIDDVARAKGELVESLPADGWAVLNAADERVAAMACRTEAQVVGFDAGGGVPSDVAVDVRAEAVRLDDQLRARFRLASAWGNAEVALEARGAHMVVNALAAAAAGLVLGLTPEEVAAGLAGAELSPWRMEVRRTAAGAVVINDAYNANPMSMRAALSALDALPHRSEATGRSGSATVRSGRRVAVLGLMAELGDGGAAEHRAIAADVAARGFELLTVGTDAYGVAPVAGIDAALERLGELGEGDAVLVKASRVVGLEALAAKLVGDGD